MKKQFKEVKKVATDRLCMPIKGDQTKVIGVPYSFYVQQKCYFRLELKLMAYHCRLLAFEPDKGFGKKQISRFDLFYRDHSMNEEELRTFIQIGLSLYTTKQNIKGTTCSCSLCSKVKLGDPSQKPFNQQGPKSLSPLSLVYKNPLDLRFEQLDEKMPCENE